MGKSTQTSSKFLTGLSLAAFFNRAQELALVILFPAIRDSLGLNYLSLGILENIRLLIQAAGEPFWRLLADRSSRKWLLAACAGFWGIWSLGCGLAADFRQLLILRMAACLGLGCFVPLALSLLKEAYDASQVDRVVSTLEAAGMLGLVVMAIVLAELLNITAIGWRYGLVILGGLSILAGVAMAVLVKNSPRRPEEESSPARLPGWLKNQFSSLVEILKRPSAWLHLLQGSLVTTTVSTLTVFSVTWLVDIKHLSQVDAPFVFAAMLVSMGVGTRVGSWVAGLAERRWPKVGRIAATQAAMLLALPGIWFLVLKAQSLPVITLGMIFVAFFLNWNRRSLQQPHMEAVMRPELQGKAIFWIELGQAVFTATAMIGFSHYADNRNLTAMLRILGIYFWAAALLVTSACYLIYPLELRRK